MPLPGLVAAGLPIAGAIGSAALQRGWALKDWHRMNAYNHPKEQVRRLREAGLPLASMFSGSGGSTSSAPQSSHVDPSLGSAQGLEKYFTNQMQRKQIQMIDEQIREQSAKADIVEGERDFKILGGKDVPIDPSDPASEGGLFHTMRKSNQVQSMEYDQRQKAAQAQTAEIVADLQRAKTQAEIDNILQTIDIGVQNERGQKILNDINDILTSKIGDGKWDLVQAMIYKLILK